MMYELSLINIRICMLPESMLLVTLAERSKAWTVFIREDAGTAGSNLTLGMDV
jgi:hypothetical protein